MTESIIANALLTGDHQLAGAQMEAHLAASQKMICDTCGGILDQSTVRVLKVRGPDNSLQSLDINCKRCFDGHQTTVRAMADCRRGVEIWTLYTWDGEEVL